MEVYFAKMSLFKHYVTNKLSKMLLIFHHRTFNLKLERR